MTADLKSATVLLQEVADVLAGHGDLRCVPTVDFVHGSAVVTLTVPLQGLAVTELSYEMEFLQRAAGVRAFRMLYGNVEPERERKAEQGQ